MEPNTNAGTTSGDDHGSICPQGWTLPPNAGDGSYYNLLTTVYKAGVNDAKLVTAPFNMAVTGLYVYALGSLNGTASGFYWSRTAKDISDAYYLVFTSGNIAPQTGSNRGDGRPVRCDEKNLLYLECDLDAL